MWNSHQPFKCPEKACSKSLLSLCKVGIIQMIVSYCLLVIIQGSMLQNTKTIFPIVVWYCYFSFLKNCIAISCLWMQTERKRKLKHLYNHLKCNAFISQKVKCLVYSSVFVHVAFVSDPGFCSENRYLIHRAACSS